MCDAINIVTAIGTVGAAVAAAFGLKAASRTATTAERQLAASWQPLIVDVPIDASAAQSRSFRLPSGKRTELPDGAPGLVQGQAAVQVTGDDGEYAIVSLRNLGGGPAAIRGASLFIRNEQVAAHWRAEQALLAPDESTRVVVSVDTESPMRGAFRDCARQWGAGISVEVDYTDLSGTSHGEVIFELEREVDRGWQVAAVRHLVLPVAMRQLTEATT